MDSKTLYKVSYGLYIVSSVRDGRYNGQIANTVFQITSEPVTIAVSINKENLTHGYIQDSGMFSVSILSKGVPMPFIGTFGFKTGRDIDKFQGVNYKLGDNGCPVVLDHAVGYLEAEVGKSLDAGTHTIFVGTVVGAEVMSADEPMTYAYYHEVKRGTAPKTAPTYVNEHQGTPTVNTDDSKEIAKMDTYRCTVCGYIYDPELGDPDSSVEPGTPFDALPDSWVCPICGSAKESFEKVES